MRRAEGLIKKCQERTKDGMAKEWERRSAIQETRCSWTAQARKASSRKRRPPQLVYPSSHGVITLQRWR
jgi:hypothetical protein